MTALTFLCSKHPFGPRDGDTVVSRVLLEAAAAAFDVRVIALSDGSPATPIPTTVVPKAPLSLARVVPRALRHHRSAIHERFTPPELVAAIDRSGAERLVARRVYMAEAALASGRAPATIVDVLESDVLAQRSALLRWEARRTRRDEQRCMVRSRSLACLAEEERRAAVAAGLAAPPRLDVVLPALRRSPLGDLALFVGSRAWAPNRAGLRRLYELWPRIAAAAPGAELLVVGAPARGEPAPPPGVRLAGYLPDLAAAWQRARALLVPVQIGGGVRVKILEAASYGVPVVAAPAALGSIGELLPIAAARDDDDFVAAAVELLRDRGVARRMGARLWEANDARWRAGELSRQLEQWLG